MTFDDLGKHHVTMELPWHVRHVDPNGLADEVISGDPKARSGHLINWRLASNGGVSPCGLTIPPLARAGNT